MPSQTKSTRLPQNDASVGSNSWSGFAVTASDDSYASVDPSNSESNYLKCTKFDFSIPTGATITGIEVNVERSADNADEIADTKVRLVKGGTVQSAEDKASATKWPTTDATATYGGSSDLWSNTWSPSDINIDDAPAEAQKFGMVISVTGVLYGGSALIDHVTMTVHYTLPAETAEATAGTTASDSSFGTNAWSNAGNATTEDDTSATSTTTSQTEYLKGTNYGFNIPTGATIDGIEAWVRKKTTDDSNSVDARVRIVKSDGTIGTTDKADTATHMDDDLTWKPYGGASDLWGESWTAEDINDTDFGFVIAEERSGYSTTFSIDSMKMVVYYTEASSPDPQTIELTPSTVKKQGVKIVG